MMEIFSALATLMFVLGLFGVLAWAIKRSGLLPGHARIKDGEKKLDIIESKMIDGRNRLVVVSWRGKEYLLATNPGGVELVDSQSGAKDQISELIDDAETK